MNQNEDREWTKWLNEEETKVLGEIDAWTRKKEDNVFTNAMKVIEKPIESAYDLIPSDLKESIGMAIAGALSMLRDSSRYTISPDSITEKVSKKLGCSMTGLKDIKSIDIRSLDMCATECINFNKCCAAVEGGGTGVAGWLGLIADIPTLYGLIFRLIQEISICYGYQVDTPEEKIHILKILEYGHAMEDATKRAGLVEIQSIQVAIRHGVPWRDIEKNVFVKALRELAKKLGINLTKRKLAQTLLIIGAIVGASVNYIMLQDIGTLAYYAYRLRFIRDRAEERKAAGIKPFR
ncbi:MAG: EcsC family protein [Anaerolineaceae bacterium]